MIILVLGKEGMLGHIVNEYLREKGYEVKCTTRCKEEEHFFDVFENLTDLEKIIDEIKPQLIVNCIAILNEFAENNHDKAVMLNSYLPQYLDKLSERYNFKLIHISTDGVFDGKKGSYKEYDFRDAVSFYGRSKALGEVDNNRNITFRTSIVGPDINITGIGLFQWFMKQEGVIKGYSKVIWAGVTSLQLAKVIEQSFDTDVAGIFHVVNNNTISKYDLLKLFKKHFDKDIIIEEYSGYSSNKTLINTRSDYSFEIPSYDTMISEMKTWVGKHPQLYKDML